MAIRKKEQQLHVEMLAQAEEEQQKFEALHKQMRGKDYGYDCKGQVCFLATIATTKFPPLDKLIGKCVEASACKMLRKAWCSCAYVEKTKSSSLLFWHPISCICFATPWPAKHLGVCNSHH